MNQYLMTASSRQKIGQAGAIAARILFNIKKWRQSWPTGHARVTVRLPGGGELTPTVRADGPNVSAILLDQEALEKAGVVRFTVEWIVGEHTKDVNIYEGVLIGEDVEALEDTSHEMGQMSEASGSYAVAEGMLTEARGDHSHTEGLGTIAGSQFQVVLGRYNQVDNDNQYALIIGGGNSDTDRKNIMKVGWDGGLWIGNTEVVQRFAGLIDGAHWAAVLARNIGDMEGRYDEQDAAIAAAEAQHEAEIQEAVTEMQTGVTEAVNDYYDMIDQQNESIDAQTNAVNEAIGNWESMVTALRNAVEEADLKILNTPNLIKPNNVWELNGSEQIVYGQTRKWYASNMPYVKNALGRNSETAGVDPDEVTVTALTLSPTIEEPDGDVITKGLQFTVASVPESGINNSEDLIFTYGNHGEGEKPQTGSITPYGEINEMTPGMEYTLSCWARVTSGTKMRLKLFWDAAKMGTYWHDEIIDITNTEWKRIYWTFTFNPTGDQWYEYKSEKTVDGQTVACTRIGAKWTKTVGFGVCRAYAGTVQLAGFRLTAGGLYGNNTVDTIRLQLAALENRVSELEATMLENIGN